MIGRVLTLALLAAPGAGMAAAHPAADLHIRSLAYDPHQVVRIRTALHRATAIELASEETISQVALGDSGAWDVAVAGPHLFLKPKPGAHETNLILTTSGAHGARTYTFELTIAKAAKGRRAPSDYVVRIGDEARANGAAEATLQAARRALEARIITLRLDRGVVEGPRNLAYAAQGAADLQPSEVSDNGRFTVLRFPHGQAIPAINTVDAAGHEALARFSVRGEFVVVEGAWPGFRLRKGREVTCLTNRAYRPAGSKSLTASPDIQRIDKEGPQ